MDEALTLRQRIMELLRECEHPLTVDEIIAMLGIDVRPREVYNHLEHIAKTVRRLSKNTEVLLMKPPTCRRCGYVFKDIKKPRKPSRCPKCRSEWIEPPAFKIARAK